MSAPPKKRTRNHHKRRWPQAFAGMPLPPVQQPYYPCRLPVREYTDGQRDMQRDGRTRRDPLHNDRYYPGARPL
jgi:hypothetical protein